MRTFSPMAVLAARMMRSPQERPIPYLHKCEFSIKKSFKKCEFSELLSFDWPQQLDRLVKVGIVTPVSLGMKSEFLGGEFCLFIDPTQI